MPIQDSYRWGLEEFWRRQIGDVTPTAFARKIGGCQDLIKRFQLYAELDGHSGCVNTVHFNETGELLVSGSDDREIVLWDWMAKLKRLSFVSGHDDNVFQAKVMPFSDNSIIISCAADGQVRQAEIMESGEVKTTQLAQHRGRVHKLAIEPGSSRMFMSCGEDGFVRHFDLRDRNNRRLFKCHTLSGSSVNKRRLVRLNAIAANPRNSNYFSVGGSDEFARVYDIRKVQWDEGNDSDYPIGTFVPLHLRDKGQVHITSVAYSHQEELLVSYNDEQIYLFGKGMNSESFPKPEIESKVDIAVDEPQVYKGHRNARTVKGVNFLGPNSEYVVSGSDCGRIFIWKKKGAELVALFKGDSQVVNCLEPHPYVTILATSGIENTAKIWAPIAEHCVPLPADTEKVMESNRKGMEGGSLYLSDIMHVLRLQRRHVQPEVARWNSRENGENHDEMDENSDIDDSIVQDYLMLFCTGQDGPSDEDEQINMRGCNMS